DGEAGDISSRLRKADNKTPLNGIISHTSHHNWDCGGRLLGCFCRRCACRNNQVHFKANKLGGEVSLPFTFSLCKSPFDDDVLSLNIPKLPQPFYKRLRSGIGIEPETA